ncbi:MULTISPECIES: DUF433 domain-containing protein [unclassified Chamaesiphon]|uniref:DUF433 domain-containing protein n=1 Tax=unclassified Chamaesiphon TaxID=2620921 RepID=UPI00286A2C64|nr:MULTISPECIES: DUF433 domain-containing protein [unclassified Chamaesiphon]
MPDRISIVSTSPDIMGGTPVFSDTRVPVQTLFDYLKAGESIDDFLDGFPTVTREQVIGLLEAARKQLVNIAA